MGRLFFDDNDKFVLTDSSAGTGALRRIQQLIRDGLGLDLDSLEDLENELASSQAKPSKTISKHIKQRYGVNMDDTTRTEIGNVLAKRVPTPITFLITFGCRGGPSDYYHRHSCFWGDFSEARDWIEDNGGGAVRAYDEQGFLVGRSWFFPYHGNLLNNGIVLFNVYGREELQHVETWGQALSDAAGVEYCQVTIKDDVTTEDGMYWNSRRGVFIGNVLRLPRKSYNVVLSLEKPTNWTYSGYPCAHCHSRVNRRELAWVIIKSKTWDEGKVCPDCLEQHYVKVTQGQGMYNYVNRNDIVYDDRGNVWLADDPDLVFCDTIRQYVAKKDTIEDERGVIHHRGDEGITFYFCPRCGRAHSPDSFSPHITTCLERIGVERI